ncbi:MAG: DUF1801 domain-containing protein [Crocinitomicaceae bacterium]|jgi:hypothetical protein|nr:DUF1801 domain-containing protein [Crocinitomicaceae bacterium]
MALVTKETTRSVQDFIARLGNASKEADSLELIRLIKEISGEEPKIWGNEKVPDFLIGFGKYTYQRKGSSEALEWFHLGFAPRKTKLTIYLSFDMTKETTLLEKLGKCKWGKGCLYINKLSDIDLEVLRELLELAKNARWH